MPKFVVYDGNIFESSSKVLGNLDYRWRFAEIVQKRSCDLRSVLENLRKSSKVVGNLRKIVKNVVSSLCNNTWLLVDMEYLLVRCTISTRARVCHGYPLFISPRSIFVRTLS